MALDGEQSLAQSPQFYPTVMGLRRARALGVLSLILAAVSRVTCLCGKRTQGSSSNRGRVRWGAASQRGGEGGGVAFASPPKLYSGSSPPPSLHGSRGEALQGSATAAAEERREKRQGARSSTTLSVTRLPPPIEVPPHRSATTTPPPPPPPQPLSSSSSSSSSAAAGAAARLKNGPMPEHVAFVLDGNGRWASQRGLPRTEGHREGAKRALEMIEVCKKLSIRHVTLFLFSTENWKRPPTEVAALMGLLEEYLRREWDSLRRREIRLACIGDTDRLPMGLQQLLSDIQADAPTAGDAAPGESERTSPQGGDAAPPSPPPTPMTLCLAISYGGRQEVVSAMQQLATRVSSGELSPEDITEASVSRALSTGSLGIPDPELIIRTSGVSRMSNFLLWQAAYSELYISPKLWPDFREDDLMESLRDFSKRERRFGRTSQQMEAAAAAAASHGE